MHLSLQTSRSMTNNYITEQRNLSTPPASSPSEKFDSVFCNYQETGSRTLHDIFCEINCHLAFENTNTRSELSPRTVKSNFIQKCLTRGDCTWSGWIHIRTFHSNPHLLYRFRQVQGSEHEHYLIQT